MQSQVSFGRFVAALNHEFTNTAIKRLDLQKSAKEHATERTKALSDKIFYDITCQGWANVAATSLGFAAAGFGVFAGAAQPFLSSIGTNASYLGQGGSQMFRAKETTDNHTYQLENEKIQSMGKTKQMMLEFLERIRQDLKNVQQMEAQTIHAAAPAA